MQNLEADALTNNVFRHFDAARRIIVKQETLPLKDLNALLVGRDAYARELEALKTKEAERMKVRVER